MKKPLAMVYTNSILQTERILKVENLLGLKRPFETVDTSIEYNIGKNNHKYIAKKLTHYKASKKVNACIQMLNLINM